MKTTEPRISTTPAHVTRAALALMAFMALVAVVALAGCALNPTPAPAGEVSVGDLGVGLTFKPTANAKVGLHKASWSGEAVARTTANEATLATAMTSNLPRLRSWAERESREMH